MQRVTVGGGCPDLGIQRKRDINEFLSVQALSIQERVVCIEL